MIAHREVVVVREGAALFLPLHELPASRVRNDSTGAGGGHGLRTLYELRERLRIARSERLEIVGDLRLELAGADGVVEFFARVEKPLRKLHIHDRGPRGA